MSSMDTLVNDRILIDNIDIAIIELDYVRRCISIVPHKMNDKYIYIVILILFLMKISVKKL